VSPSAAIKLMQRVAATGGSAPEPSGGRRPLLLGPHADMLKAMAEANAASRWSKSRPSSSVVWA
jgi:hypothetical protein